MTAVVRWARVKTTVRTRGSWLVWVALSATLSACGHSTPAPSAQTGGVRPKAVVSDANALSVDMVAAVSQGGSGTPIAMRFRLASRPVVGSPVRIDVALIPAADAEVSHIHATFVPGDGLQLGSDRSVDITDPTPGQAVEQEVTVTPQQPGVLSLSATVLVEMDTGSIARTYTVPLIAVPAAS